MGGESTKLTLTYYAGGKIVGLESERPLTNNLPANTTFIETDTLLEYIWDGVSTWNIIGTSPFSPTDIPGLEHWYDATDFSTITKDGSDRVSQWDDKQGTENLLQGSAGSQPLWVEVDQNGNSVINCTGNRSMETSGAASVAQPVSLYMALKLPAFLASTQRIIEAENLACQFLDNDGNFWKMSAPTDLNAANADEEDTWTVVKLVYNGTSSSMEMNAISKAFGNAGTNSHLGLDVSGNAGNNSNIIVGEITKYSTVLSAFDDNEIVTYLSDKWGIPV